MTTIDQPPPALAATDTSGEQSYHAHIVACVNAVPPSVPLPYNEWSSRRLLEHDRKLNALQRHILALQRRQDAMDGGRTCPNEFGTRSVPVVRP